MKTRPNRTIIHVSIRLPSRFSLINNKLQSVSFVQFIINNTILFILDYSPIEIPKEMILYHKIYLVKLVI